MALKKVQFAPGFNKQSVPSALPGRWVDGDFVRFRYSAPEKIGGWEQLTVANETLPGAARAQLAFASLKGERYTAIGTSQGLFLYYGENFYDITPLDTAITGATFDTNINSTSVTVNKTAHNLALGRYITFTAVTAPPGSGFVDLDFTEGAFEIVQINDANSFNIVMRKNASANTTNVGSATINPYVEVGPTIQTTGYGWGTYLWGNSTWGTARGTSNVILDPGGAVTAVNI